MRRRRLRLAAVVLACASVASVGACGAGRDAADTTSTGYVQTSGETRYFTSGDRKPAPEVSGPLLGGGDYRLADQLGHVVVLNLWGSWCPDCRAEASDLESVYRARQAGGVSFVGVDIRDDDDLALAFTRRKSITYPSIDDPAGRVLLGFRDVPPSAIPSTVVVDPQGRVAAVHLGSITAAELNDLIAKAST